MMRKFARTVLLTVLLCSSCFLATQCQPIGVHFDVEPHTLSEWSSEPSKTSIANQFVDLVSKLRDALGTSKRLTMDVAFEYSSYAISRAYRNSTTTVSQPLLSFVLDAGKNAILMDYRNYAATCPPAPYNSQAYCVDADSILSHARDALDVAKSLNQNSSYLSLPGKSPVKIGVGVETDPSQTPVKVTFGTMTERQLEVALNETSVLLGNTYGSTLSGVAVHAISFYNQSAFLNLGSQPALPPASQRVCRGLWVWQQDYVMNSGAYTFDSLINFCLAHAVDVIFIESQTLVSDPATYQGPFQTFVTRLRAASIGVEMLFGYSIWARAANHQAAVNLAISAASYMDAFNTTSTYPKPMHCIPNPAYAAYYTDSGSVTSTASASGSSAMSSSGSNVNPLPNASSSIVPGFSLALLLCVLAALVRA